MKAILSKGTTGEPKITFYGEKELAIINRQADRIRKIVGIDKQIIYNIFPFVNPHLAFWQTTNLSTDDNIVFDIGNMVVSTDEKIKETIKKILTDFPPQIIIGHPDLIMKFIREYKITNLQAIITGAYPATDEIKLWTMKNSVNLFITYGQTDLAFVFITDSNWYEGYHLESDDFKVEIAEDGEILINGNHTGDKGFVNEYEKLDLDIARINN